MAFHMRDEAFAEAKRYISEAALYKETSLSLDGLGLTTLPESLGQLARLEELDLSKNQLATLPEELGQLAQLQTLLLGDNQLTTLPDELGQLVQLQELDIRNNQLAMLPDELGQLVQLQELDIRNNQLTALPESLGQLSRLKGLYAGRNRLAALPESLGQLAQLVVLSLNGNQLTSLPESLGQLAQLRQLYLAQNQLDLLPEWLRRLTSLQALFLHDNPKLGLPRTVLGPTWEECERSMDRAPKPGPILDYYSRTRRAQDRRPLREAKLILVGRGEVGKTSLVQRLLENKFSRREDRTQGIRITQWPLKLKRREEVRLHVWDFGGQEIMHATHQFFLTDRSVYLLVLDGRAGQQEVEADYWLRLIASFAPESHVLVVLNKIRKDPFDLNRRALQAKYSQVCGFIETDCDNPSANGKPGSSGWGIEDLRQAIIRETDKLPDLRSPFPTSWFEIKEELSTTQKNYQSFDEYRALCRKHGEEDDEAQNSLAVHLHRLGIALNFCDDPRLRDTHLLNPQWVTQGIYTLLNSDTLTKRKGELDPDDLRKELVQKDYPQKMHQFLLDLMEKFELCFSFPKRDRYLIPELLAPQEPVEAAKFDPTACLNFQYHYPVIPPGLLPRFIVRTHVLSEKHRWRTGVILHFEGNDALVKADLQDRKVFISIAGPVVGRRRMLAVIRQSFEHIHRDIQHLNPAEMVPLPQHPGEFVPYRHLEVLEQKNQDAMLQKVIGDSEVYLPVKALLEGVDLAQRVGHEEHERSATIFVSYAHLDDKQRLKLRMHLAPLVWLKQILLWDDRSIPPGADWETTIDQRLNEAYIVLLLISKHYVHSAYCMKEAAVGQQRHEAGQACVIPIILSPVNGWDKMPFGKLNALPTSGKAIPKWKPQDDGWANVAQGVEHAAKKLLEKRLGR